MKKNSVVEHVHRLDLGQMIHVARCSGSLDTRYGFASCCSAFSRAHVRLHLFTNATYSACA